MPPTGVIRHFIPRITRRGNGLSTREYHFAAMKRRRGAALEAVSFERCVMSCATQMFGAQRPRSEEHTSELQSLMRISYAVFCLKKKNKPIMKSNKPSSKYNLR